MSDQTQPSSPPLPHQQEHQPGQLPAYPASAPSARRTGSSFGWIALIVGALLVLNGIAVPALLTLGIIDPCGANFALVTILQGVLTLALAATALVLGIVGIRRDASPVPGAIAIGIAGSTLATVLATWAINAALSLVY